MKLKFILVMAGVFAYLQAIAAPSDQELSLLLDKPFIKANFTKERKLKILSRPFVTSGILLFLPDKGVVWQTQLPIVDTIVITQSGIRELKQDPDSVSNRMAETTIMKSVARVFLSLFSLNLERIKQEFNVTKTYREKDRKYYELESKDETLAKVISRIVLSGKQRIDTILIEEKTGDSTRITLDKEVFDKTSLTTADLELLKQL